MSETLAAKAAELASQALLLLVVPRALGPSGYGEFAAAFGAVSLVSLALGLGAPLAAMRYVPRADPRERHSLARAVAAHVAISRARQLAALTAVALVAGALIPNVPLGLVAAVCAASWFSVGSSVASELALALGRPRVWNARFPVENVLVTVAAVVGNATFGTSGAVVGIAFASVCTFAVLAAPVVPVLRRAPSAAGLPAGADRYARFETASVILTTVILRGSPAALLVLGASRVQIGYAAIATGIGAAGVGIVLSLVVVQLPRLADLARSNPSEAEAEARRHALVALAIVVAVATPVAAFARPLLRVALGAGFVGARDALVIALCAPALAAAIGLAGQLARLRLRPAPLTLAWTCGAAVFAVVIAAAEPGLGARGASLAMVAGLAATSGAALALLRDRPLRQQLALSSAAAACVLALGWPI
jgi:O-antigen/teichoic acid export membrane protein